METEQIEKIAILRTAVGFLGEKDQSGWWPSSFFEEAASAFLAPIFPRTQTLAQYEGVRQAAAVVHDDRIGVGNVCHLFRLSEGLEQRLHQIVQQAPVASELMDVTADIKTAKNFISQFSVSITIDGVGPVRVGKLIDINELTSWQQAAALYAKGLSENTEIFPYFSDV